MDERFFYLSFSLVNNIGPVAFNKLINYFGSAKDAWNGSSKDLREAGLGPKIIDDFNNFRKDFDLSNYWEKLQKTKCYFIASCEEDYPEGLKRLPNPPIVLFTKGDKSCLKTEKTFGVVGARKMTSYGEAVTESLVADLTAFGFTIVSGMALGVDAKAHEACLENNGKTIAVLGNGVDLPFPRENENLYYKILDGGGLVISEFPIGMQPSVGSFPARNRIIAALSLGVLITEAAEDSGSLITAEWGFKLQKKVFAVPGPITSSMSSGSTKLLKQGAILVQSSKDILDEFSISSLQFSSKSRKIDLEKLNLSKDEKLICKLLENEGMRSDEISKQLNMNIVKMNIVLSDLEMKGILKSDGGKFMLALT